MNEVTKAYRSKPFPQQIIDPNAMPFKLSLCVCVCVSVGVIIYSFASQVLNFQDSIRGDERTDQTSSHKKPKSIKPYVSSLSLSL